MANSSITVSELIVSGGFLQNTLSWTVTDPHRHGLPYFALDAVEVWVSESSTLDAETIPANASLVGDGINSRAHPGLAENSGNYYYLRARDMAGNYGDWLLTDGVARPPAPRIAYAVSSVGDGGGNPSFEIPQGYNVGVSVDADGELVASIGDGFNLFGASVFGRKRTGSSPAVVGMHEGAGFAFLAVGGGGYGPFTGQHEALLDPACEIERGDVVCDVAVISRDPVALKALTRIDRSTSGRQVAVGVLWNRTDATDGRAIFNGLGEGLINVCGSNGPIAPGDLLVASDVPGKAMRQDDDIVRSCTVARAREGVALNGANDRAQIACIYLCG